MKYEVEQQVLQAVLSYLAERPYKEVINLVQALQQVKPIYGAKEDAVEESIEQESNPE